MLKRYRPLNYKHLVVQDSDTESDNDIRNHRMAHPPILFSNPRSISKGKRKGKEKLNSEEDEEHVAAKPTMPPNFDPEAIVELAREYQKHMKKTPIPRARLTHAVVVSWQGLAKTLKNLYGQPLHYLTHKLCKQWDKSRFGGEDAEKMKPLDGIFSGTKAEAIIWEVEAVHRLSTSHLYLANLWVSDPEFHAFVHEVFPSS